MKNRNRIKRAIRSSTSQDSALLGKESKMNKPQKPLVCWHCEEAGHIKRFRPKLKVNEKLNTASTVEYSPPEDQTTENAFTELNRSTTKGRWIIDSGATSHMTFQRDCLMTTVNLKDQRRLDSTEMGESLMLLELAE